MVKTDFSRIFIDESKDGLEISSGFPILHPWPVL